MPEGALGAFLHNSHSISLALKNAGQNVSNQRGHNADINMRKSTTGMKISTILDHIDSGHMALPEFQRGYVWNRDQVRGLFDSLYKRHPVGGLLVWATESKDAAHRGDGKLAAGVVKLLLDGQQRMTSLYGVVRGKPPNFFDGKERTFTGLRFHLQDEIFSFYQPLKMRDDPLWIDVTDLMQQGMNGLGGFVSSIMSDDKLAPMLGDYTGRLSRLLGIMDVDLHIEEVTGAAMTIDTIVDIFNRLNSGGTKLSKGDLALAKIWGIIYLTESDSNIILRSRRLESCVIQDRAKVIVKVSVSWNCVTSFLMKHQQLSGLKI